MAPVVGIGITSGQVPAVTAVVVQPNKPPDPKVHASNPLAGAAPFAA